MASVLQKNKLNTLVRESLGKSNLNHLSKIELDVFLRQITKNLEFYYEDYFSKG